MSQYFLMHRNDICGEIVFDDKTGHVVSYKDYDTGLSPYLGNADVAKIKKWWEMRAIPAARIMIQEIIKTTDCLNAEMYLAKNLALSMTDSYWVCPTESGLKYDQVKCSNLRRINGEKIPYHNATSYDSDYSHGQARGVLTAKFSL